MRIDLALSAWRIALFQSTLDGEAGRVVVEQRTQSFTIGLNGSVADVTPLFGPVREAEWAPEWSPRFIHPAQGAQEDGVVFNTTTGPGKDRLWLLTTYDIKERWNTWLRYRRSRPAKSKSVLFPTANSVVRRR